MGQRPPHVKPPKDLPESPPVPAPAPLVRPEHDPLGADPVRYVVSENMRRRHLTDAQRAMIAARLAKLPAHRPTSADLRTSMRTSEAAKVLSVAPRTVEAAKTDRTSVV